MTFYNVLKTKDILDDNEKFAHEQLLADEKSSFSIISIKKNEIIDTHTSTSDTAVYVIKGEIEIHFSAEKFELKEEEMILFKKDDEHKVLAKKDSIFFIVKIG